MFNTLSLHEFESINPLSKSERNIDVGTITLKIQNHLTRILNKYLDKSLRESEIP